MVNKKLVDALNSAKARIQSVKEKYRERYAGHQNRNKSNISDYVSQGGGVSEADNLDYSEIIREANTVI